MTQRLGGKECWTIGWTDFVWSSRPPWASPFFLRPKAWKRRWVGLWKSWEGREIRIFYKGQYVKRQNLEDIIRRNSYLIVKIKGSRNSTKTKKYWLCPGHRNRHSYTQNWCQAKFLAGLTRDKMSAFFEILWNLFLLMLRGLPGRKNSSDTLEADFELCLPLSPTHPQYTWLSGLKPSLPVGTSRL